MSQNLPAEEPIRIVGICGSLRANGYTRYAVQSALQGAELTGAQPQLLELRNYDLPFCDGRRDESSYPPDLTRLCLTVQQAHGIILGTPVYHGSYSGVLKNTLDLMGFREFEGKMIGLVGVSGGQTGAVSALNALRTIGRTLHAWVIPEEVSIPQAWKAFDDSGRPRNPDLEKRLHALGRQVARYAYLHTSEQALEFLKMWETAPENPGATRQ